MTKEEMESIKITIADHMIATEESNNKLELILSEYDGEIPDVAFKAIQHYKVLHHYSGILIATLVEFIEKECKN